MIRDVTGLNEARDGSTPDKNALVGVQKLAAANSNTATRHILQSMMYLTAEAAECLSLRISDIIEYSPTREAFIRAIGAHNVATLEELKDLHLYDFGIFIELMPDEEEKQMLENNIQVALAQQLIDLDDAIDLRNVRNVKLANQLLKVKKKKKQEKDQLVQQQNIQAQSQANAQAQQVAAQAEVQKNQAKTQSEAQLEQAKNELKMQYLEREAEVKKELMKLEFELNSQLQSTERQSREKIADMKNKGQSIKTFESSGNDIVTGEAGLDKF
jgi:DNA repair exonuclease SbcCD ATPase subunit